MADLFTLAEADDLERRRAARARIHKLARAIGKDDWRWIERRVRKLPGFKEFDVLLGMPSRPAFPILLAIRQSCGKPDRTGSIQIAAPLGG